MLEVPQYIINIVAGTIMAALGWFARMLWDDLKRLEREHAKLREHLAENYAKKTDMKDSIDAIMRQIETVAADVKDGFNKVFDRMDRKADKP